MPLGSAANTLSYYQMVRVVRLVLQIELFRKFNFYTDS